MIWPFTYDGEPCQIGDNIALVQALERCAAAYRNRCLNNSSVEHPNQMWVRLYSATERLKQAVCRNNVAQAILEIGSDLMGCDDMTVLELHGDSTLSLLAGPGMNGRREQELSTNAKAIASAIKKRQISIVNTDTPYNELWSELGIAAFVPVWHENAPRGAIIFTGFFRRKATLIWLTGSCCACFPCLRGHRYSVHKLARTMDQTERPNFCVNSRQPLLRSRKRSMA